MVNFRGMIFGCIRESEENVQIDSQIRMNNCLQYQSMTSVRICEFSFKSRRLIVGSIAGKWVYSPEVCLWRRWIKFERLRSPFMWPTSSIVAPANAQKMGKNTLKIQNFIWYLKYNASILFIFGRCEEYSNKNPP